MPNSIAILIGNAEYDQESDLPCCRADVEAVQMLLHATDKYEAINTVLNADADQMRQSLRKCLDSGPYDEVFFYFSGHGWQSGSELYYCGTHFDDARPRQTGLSNNELHDLVRAAAPNLFVKVLDTCFSGTLLVKGEQPAVPLPEKGFKYVIQFSSSLDDQPSLAGEPLSQFTEAFCRACIQKLEGPVYYSDVANVLRDEFIDNNDQVPLFVHQSTGREVLVDDARKLSDYIRHFATMWGKQHRSNREDTGASADGTGADVPPSTKQLLLGAEDRMGGPEEAKSFIDKLFDGVISRFKEGEFGELFISNIVEHSTYRETAVHDSIVKVLSRESRPDSLVTAEVRREKKKQNPYESFLQPAFLQTPEWIEFYDLELNCKLSRAQLRVDLVPSYKTLQQLVLVLTCAPSLELCYIFESITQHPRVDWAAFAEEGREIVRRWYKLEWASSPSGVVEKVCVALEDAVRKHIKETTERLRKA